VGDDEKINYPPVAAGWSLFPTHQLILPVSRTPLLVNNYFLSALQADEVATAIRQPPKADKATDDRTSVIGEMLP
jgi:hypothetical protein